MTSADLALDFSTLLADPPLLLYRLARSKYANLSGAGAANAPGRWNRPGQEALYTSTEMGVPLLERLVHTPKDLIPSNLAMMTLSLSGSWEFPRDTAVRNVTTAIEEDSGAHILIFPAVASAKHSFDQPSFKPSSRVVALAVPSVIIPVWNLVLYPQSDHFWTHVTLQGIDPFNFDPRLFSENASVEISM